MVNGAMDMGRDIITTAELYDSNILKGTQESRTERVLVLSVSFMPIAVTVFQVYS
jgi:hypothetical protein